MDLDQFDHGVFMVNLLAIVHDPKDGHFLIGRREDDEQVNELTWCFPGGRAMEDQTLEERLAEKVQGMTGISIEVGDVIFARRFPSSSDMLLLYYECQAIGGELEARGDFIEVKWADPDEITELFTTSIDRRLKAKLQMI